MTEFLKNTSDEIGLLGVLLTIIAYFLLSTNRMSSQTLKYQLMNLIGAALILYSLIFHFNLSSMVIEVTWILISLTGIYRILKDKKNKSASPVNVYQFKQKRK